MAYIGLPPKANFTSGLLDRFTSTTGTTVTLTHDISSENDIVVFVNFVKQDSTTYSVGGTGNKTLTLGGTLVSSDIVEVHYLNIVGQTVNPSANSVGSSQLTADSITGQTAETSIATDDTVLIHDTSAGALRKMTRANFVSGIGGTNTPAFAATVSGTQAISNNTHTVIAFDNELYDTNNAYDNSTYRFTVPSGEAGTYYLKLSGYLNTADDFEPVNFQLKKNGSAMIYSYGRNFYYNTFSNSITIALSVGDYIEALVFQQSGSSKNIVVDNNNYFCGHKLIGV